MQYKIPTWQGCGDGVTLGVIDTVNDVDDDKEVVDDSEPDIDRDTATADLANDGEGEGENEKDVLTNVAANGHCACACKSVRRQNVSLHSRKRAAQKLTSAC